MSGPEPPGLAALLADDPLRAELLRAQAAGLIGPGVLDRQVTHAWGFAAPLPSGPARVVDLGAGGGLPGLVLARARPAWSLVLADAAARRCRYLEEAVIRLGLADRVEVVHIRAEDLGRTATRATADAVVARSFGPPPVVAECAAPLLAVGGHLVVSEPPDAPDRWPVAGCALVGLRPGQRVEVEPHRFGYQVLVQVAPCPDRYPRRPGVPARRPLF